MSLQHFIHQGSVFVDVGANVGVYTVKAAREVGESGLVIAIEPFIQTLYQLSLNVEANRYNNVRIRNLCIGRNTQEGRLYLNKRRPISFSMLPIGDADGISALSASLDDLCRWEQLEQLDYLKIDAEGAEDEILRGGAKTISRYRPIIQVEITKADSSLSFDYRRFAAAGSPNNMLIPAENNRAIETAKKLGWLEVPTTRQALGA